jgi:hypothetical protein
MFHCVLLHLLRVVAPGYPQVIYHTVMVFSGLRHLLHLHLALLLPLLRLCPPLQRELMNRGSPHLPQTRKSPLKINGTGDNGHVCEGGQLTKQLGICPDSATLNSRYGGRYRVQDILVRRVMPHRLARLQQEVSCPCLLWES